MTSVTACGFTVVMIANVKGHKVSLTLIYFSGENLVWPEAVTWRCTTSKQMYAQSFADLRTVTSRELCCSNAVDKTVCARTERSQLRQHRTFRGV